MKIITVHSTNREKGLIANILRSHLNGCSDLILLSGYICMSVSRHTVGAGLGAHTHTRNVYGHSE